MQDVQQEVEHHDGDGGFRVEEIKGGEKIARTILVQKKTLSLHSGRQHFCQHAASIMPTTPRLINSVAKWVLWPITQVT